jgi:class 3 adenylate cyclase/predicted ATPase
MTQFSSQNQLVQALVSYLPPAVARAIHADPLASIEARAAHFPAAVLFTDVSGFTALTEKLAAHGPGGAEELTLLLNQYLSRMIGLLEEQGGEVVQFSGDALVAVFPADLSATDDPFDTAQGRRRSTTDQLTNDQRPTTNDEVSATSQPPSFFEHRPPSEGVQPLQLSVRRAWQAAARMQEAMAEFAMLETSIGGVALGMKICIGAGDVLGLSVGGVLNRWQYIIAGDPLAQVAEAGHIAERGEIVLSPEARALLGDQPAPPQPRAPLHWDTLTEATIAALRTHIPGAITHRLMAGQADWLAEIRRMTILFLGIGGLQETGPSALDQIQATMLAFQQTVYRYEGSINKLLVDDKGVISIVLFGAPPMSHLDDPLRAVRCALDLQADAERLGLDLAIGVTTGQVFSGPVGSSTRREYTVIGDAVNLAARLMQLAGRGGVYCDHATFHATRADMQWQELAPQTVKGKAAAVRLYRPLGQQSAQARHSQIHDFDSAALVGRAAEVARLELLLEQAVVGQMRVLCLEGDPGIGKSRLVAELARRMRERGLVGLIGRGQAIEQQTAYRSWQEIFGTFFDLENLADIAAQRRRVQERLAEIAPSLIERAPLLNDLLGLGLPETTLTEHLDPKLRQASLSSLLIDLLGLWAAERPLVIVLEDAQWLDSLSWQLALQLARSLTQLPLLLVLALRPLENAAPDHPYRLLCGLSGSEQLALDVLGPGETAELAAARLGAAELPPAIVTLIEQHAAGNPFVAEELAFSLRDSGTLEVVDGHGVLRANHRDLRLPDTVQGLVLSRIDRLPAGQQLTLKVASVIGRVFGYSTLLDVYPSSVEEVELRTHLASLSSSAMVLSLEPPSALRSHMFKQVITQEATYSTLLLAQRRDLHERVASWYELFAEEQADLYPLLAYHWRQAQKREEELQYSMLAAKKLAAEYANDEALSYLNRALELTDDPIVQHDAIWLRAEIHERIGDTAARQADLRRLDQLVDRQHDVKRQAQLLNAWAAFYRDTSDYPAAVAALEQAIAVAHTIDDQASEARSLTIWGQVMEYQGAFSEAQNYFEQALTLYRRIAYRRGEATNLSHLGNVHHYLGAYQAARTYDLEALAIRRSIGDRASEATSLTNLGIVSIQLGEIELAKGYQQQALQLTRAIGDRSGEALSLANIGHIYQLQGDFASARRYVEDALRVCQTLGERRREANCLNVLGQVWRDVGDYARAQRCFEEALTIQLEIGDHSQAAYSAGNLAYLLTQSDAPGLEARYQQALDLAGETGNREAEAAVLSYRAGLHERHGRWDAAASDHQTALAIWEELDIAAAAIEDRAGLGRVARALGHGAEAGRQAALCIAHLAAHGIEGMEFPMAVYLACYDILRDAGNIVEADRLLDEARTLLTQRADAITDLTMRESFLHNIAMNRRVLEEGGQ